MTFKTIEKTFKTVYRYSKQFRGYSEPFRRYSKQFRSYSKQFRSYSKQFRSYSKQFRSYSKQFNICLKLAEFILTLLSVRPVIEIFLKGIVSRDWVGLQMILLDRLEVFNISVSGFFFFRCPFHTVFLKSAA